jgi:hypothetical protein
MTPQIMESPYVASYSPQVGIQAQEHSRPLGIKTSSPVLTPYSFQNTQALSIHLCTPSGTCCPNRYALKL